jgi:glycosyltransferase involved in cell wall biosynthesis
MGRTVELNKNILLFENNGRDFLNARLPLANYLINKGFKVYALIPEDEYLSKIQSFGIKVISYKFNRKNKGLFQILKLVYILIKNDRKHNFDIIHSFRFQPNLVSSLASFFLRSKLIVHVTGLGISFSVFSIKYYFIRLASKLLYLLVMIRCDKIIFQNEFDQKNLYFSQFFHYKINIIYGSGIDIEKFKRKNSKMEIRKKLGIDLNDCVFIMSSRLIKEKGILELVNAFLILNSMYSNIRLLILGSQDLDNPRNIDDDFIKFYSNDKISFLGHVFDVKEYLTASDFYIYPSYYREGIPRGILEAMAMQLPIITTNLPGCVNTVKNFYNGYFIRPKSIKSIVNICNRAIINQNQYLLGINSRELAKKYFSNNIIFEQIANLY